MTSPDNLFPGILFKALLLMCLLPAPAFAQMNSGNPYRLRAEITATYAADTTPFRHQTVAWNYSFIGDYRNALLAWDSGGRRNPIAVSSADSLAFRRLRWSPARDYILARAKTERVILINEAHHNPRHRVFTASLLKALYAQGYRYFLAEGIDSADAQLQIRRYPALATGFYVGEPQYGNLLREAFRNGYEVRGYDFGTAGGGREREIVAARQVAAILARDSAAKIIIHCGFDHIIETDYRGWEKALAGRIAEFTGINPFTIDQTKLSETGREDFAHPFYRIAAAEYRRSLHQLLLIDSAFYQPTVLTDSSGRVFNGVFEGPGRYDVQIMHPPVIVISGRPDWLHTGRNRSYLFRPENVTFPVLLLAYREEEDRSMAIPVDAVQMNSKSVPVALMLPEGSFVIICVDAAGKRQELKVKL